MPQACLNITYITCSITLDSYTALNTSKLCQMVQLLQPLLHARGWRSHLAPLTAFRSQEPANAPGSKEFQYNSRFPSHRIAHPRTNLRLASTAQRRQSGSELSRKEWIDCDPANKLGPALPSSSQTIVRDTSLWLHGSTRAPLSDSFEPATGSDPQCAERHRPVPGSPLNASLDQDPDGSHDGVQIISKDDDDGIDDSVHHCSHPESHTMLRYRQASRSLSGPFSMNRGPHTRMESQLRRAIAFRIDSR